MAHRFTTVEVGCDGPFAILARRPHAPLLTRRIEARLREVLGRWGIDAEPRCSIRPGALKPIDVRIHGRSIDYPWTQLRELRAQEWQGADVEAMLDAAEAVIERALTQNPSAYLNAQQAAEYAGHPVADDRTTDTLAILRSLLWLGVSLEEKPYIRDTIRRGREVDVRADELIESLFADLRGHVRVYTSPQGKSQLTTSKAEEVDARSEGCRPDLRKELEDLERQLYLTTGIQLPDIILTVDPDLADGSIAVQTNAYREPPTLVRDARMNAVLIPVLQRSAHRLLGMQDVESQLAQLQASSPELVQAALGRVSSAQLTRTLREMLRESLSIRDLRAILDRLLSFETIPVDVGQPHICDGRLPVLRGAKAPPSVRYLDFIRHGLKHRLVRDDVQGHVIASIDAATQTRLENGLRRSAWPSDRQLRTLKDALGTEIEQRGGRMPVSLIVRPTIRWHVRRMLGAEFPDLAVLAATEVPVEVALEPAFSIGTGGRTSTGDINGSRRATRTEEPLESTEAR